jgi:hypothetical protein
VLPEVTVIRVFLRRTPAAKTWQSATDGISPIRAFLSSQFRKQPTPNLVCKSPAMARTSGILATHGDNLRQLTVQPGAKFEPQLLGRRPFAKLSAEIIDDALGFVICLCDWPAVARG